MENENSCAPIRREKGRKAGAAVGETPGALNPEGIWIAAVCRVLSPAGQHSCSLSHVRDFACSRTSVSFRFFSCIVFPYIHG